MIFVLKNHARLGARTRGTSDKNPKIFAIRAGGVEIPRTTVTIREGGVEILRTTIAIRAGGARIAPCSTTASECLHGRVVALQRSGREVWAY